MTSLNEVITAVATACDKASECKDALGNASDFAEDCQAILGSVLDGDTTGDKDMVLASFQDVIDGVKDLWKVLGLGMDHAQAVLDQLQGIDRRSSSPAPPSVATPVPTPGSRVREVLEELPDRSSANRKTNGVLLGREGQPDQPMVSGRDADHVEITTELRRLGLAPARGTLWAAEHVEVKMAVHLRHGGGNDETLIVNNPPCDTGEWSCDTLLPQVLRPGQRLTVHWPGDSKTYTGKVR